MHTTTLIGAVRRMKEALAVAAIAAMALAVLPTAALAEGGSNVLYSGGAPLTVLPPSAEKLNVHGLDWAAPAADPDTESKPAVVETMQDTLLDVCKAYGYAEDCAKTLLGMVWKESSGQAKAVGDHGLALGYFQIHYKMHRVTPECATDLRCSAKWTLDYLESNGYPKYPLYAIQCHNSCNVGNGYAASALRKGNYYWNKGEVSKAKADKAIAQK